jgi:hypothetical protein
MASEGEKFAKYWVCPEVPANILCLDREQTRFFMDFSRASRSARLMKFERWPLPG